MAFNGVLKNFFEDKGFGFIRPEDGSGDCFVHVRDNPGLVNCGGGEKVTFDKIYDDVKGKYKAEIQSLRTDLNDPKPAGRGRSRSPKKGGAGGVSMTPNPTAKFITTKGEFYAEIFLDRVPITASNFIDLALNGFYEGIHFHRVIPGFMNQFGCPNARNPNAKNAGMGGPPDGVFKNLKTGDSVRRRDGGNIPDENISRDTNAKGTMSMANTGRPNTGGSQFFINVANNDQLDWFTPGPSKHPVFAKIVKGMDVCEAISQVQTHDDNPLGPIKMMSITISGLPA